MLLDAIPRDERKSLSSRLRKDEPWSLWMYSGSPNMVKRLTKQHDTVDAEMSEQGNTQGNLLYSSMTFRKKRFLFVLGSGPLKSTLSLSKGRVDLIKVAGSGDL